VFELSVKLEKRKSDDPDLISELEKEKKRYALLDGYFKTLKRAWFKQNLEREVNRERAVFKVDTVFEGKTEKAKVDVRVGDVTWSQTKGRGVGIPKISYTIKVNTESGPDFKEEFFWTPSAGEASPGQDEPETNEPIEDGS
jgi:hypothetical protein